MIGDAQCDFIEKCYLRYFSINSKFVTNQIMAPNIYFIKFHLNEMNCKIS